MAQFQIQVNRIIESGTIQVVPNNFSDFTEAEIWLKFKSGDECNTIIGRYITYVSPEKFLTPENRFHVG